MYGSSYYGGSDVLSLLAAAGGVWLTLSFIAFVAAIVCTVLIYRKFVSSQEHRGNSLGKHDFGPFLRFEKFWSEKILIVLFIYNMCSIAFECAAAAIALLFAIAYSPSGAIMGILLIALLFVVSEVMNRLFFEFIMLIVKMWRNTQEIRAAVAGGSCSEGAASCSAVDVDDTTPQVQQQVPVRSGSATVSSSKTMPISVVEGASHSDTSWVCPACGAANKSGVFCAQCGKHRV